MVNSITNIYHCPKKTYRGSAKLYYFIPYRWICIRGNYGHHKSIATKTNQNEETLMDCNNTYTWIPRSVWPQSPVLFRTIFPKRIHIMYRTQKRGHVSIIGFTISTIKTTRCYATIWRPNELNVTICKHKLLEMAACSILLKILPCAGVTHVNTWTHAIWPFYSANT